jgi:acyl-CoA thioester hydrolase
MVYEKRIEIRWGDMDGFLHVNNAVYLTYLEEARDEFFTHLLGHDRVGFMVARHISIDFESGLTQDDDEAVVRLRVARLGTSSVTTSETIEAGADGRLAARAETVMVHCDGRRAASQPFPEEARALLEGVLE